MLSSRYCNTIPVAKKHILSVVLVRVTTNRISNWSSAISPVMDSIWVLKRMPSPVSGLMTSARWFSLECYFILVVLHQRVNQLPIAVQHLMYMRALQWVIWRSGLCCLQYTDDTELYLSFSTPVRQLFSHGYGLDVGKQTEH